MTTENPKIRKVQREEFTALQNDFLKAVDNAVQARSSGGNSSRHYEEAPIILRRVESYRDEGSLDESGEEVLREMKRRYAAAYTKLSSVSHTTPQHSELLRKLPI